MLFRSEAEDLFKHCKKETTYYNQNEINMKNKILTLVALLLIAATACKKPEKEAENKLIASDVVPVRVAALETATLSGDIVATGLLTTENDARLAFKIGGVIDRIYVTEGQTVKQGQLLATLKTGEINAQIEQTRLGLEKAKRDFNRSEERRVGKEC